MLVNVANIEVFKYPPAPTLFDSHRYSKSQPLFSDQCLSAQISGKSFRG
jgi:hypothetical protein